MWDHYKGPMSATTPQGLRASMVGPRPPLLFLVLLIQVIVDFPYPRHSIYAIYADQLGWFWVSIGRHIWQSRGVFGHCG